MEADSDRLTATYRVEGYLPLEELALRLAGEQSTGTHTNVPGETQGLVESFGARVERVDPLGENIQPSLPTTESNGRDGGADRGCVCGEVKISFASGAVGSDVPAILAAIAGNVFELRVFTGLRLLDIDFPQSYAQRYAGPQFGVEGTRELAGVSSQPLIGAVIKPSVGLSPDQTAEMVDALADGGIDFIKDDELMTDLPNSAFAERVSAVMGVINRRMSSDGKKVMYAFNVSGEVDRMLERHDVVKGNDGTCVMVSLNAVGAAGVVALRKHSTLPIHGHRNGWGILSRSPALGMDFQAYQKLWRLVGVDQIHVGGIQSKFAERDDSVVDSIRACGEPLFAGRRPMPVLSSGQWAGLVDVTYAAIGTADVIYVAGGGILGHPGGIAAGVASIRQAWSAALSGVPLAEAATDNQELRQALAHFGRRKEGEPSAVPAS